MMVDKKCGCYAVPVNNSQVFYHCPLHKSAPDLLAACEVALSALNLMNYSDAEGDAEHILRAAIAKAKGE